MLLVLFTGISDGDVNASASLSSGDDGGGGEASIDDELFIVLETP